MQSKPTHISSFPYAMLVLGLLAGCAAVTVSHSSAPEHPVAVAMTVLAFCSMIAAAISFVIHSIGQNSQT